MRLQAKFVKLRYLLGINSYPLWINEAGEIVGEADISDVENALGQFPHHAFLWQNGTGMTDLGTLGSTSHAESINNKGQVVGRPDSMVFCERTVGP